MARKQKNTFSTNSCKSKYINFGSANNRRKNKKRYFEHDTRTTTTTTTTANSHLGKIEKIKFNNEINIFEANQNVSQHTKQQPQNHHHQSQSLSTQLRAKSKRKFMKKSTKQLQQQLIETQKKLQKQLIELKHYQNNSLLALLCSNCNHAHDQDQVHVQDKHLIHNNFNKTFNRKLTFCNNNQIFNAIQKRPTEKTAKGKKTTTIRSKQFVHNKSEISPIQSHFNLCMAHMSPENVSSHSKDRKIIKKPILKSIILSANDSSVTLSIKKKNNENEIKTKTQMNIAIDKQSTSESIDTELAKRKESTDMLEKTNGNSNYRHSSRERKCGKKKSKQKSPYRVCSSERNKRHTRSSSPNDSSSQSDRYSYSSKRSSRYRKKRSHASRSYRSSTSSSSSSSSGSAHCYSYRKKRSESRQRNDTKTHRCNRDCSSNCKKMNKKSLNNGSNTNSSKSPSVEYPTTFYNSNSIIPVHSNSSQRDGTSLAKQTIVKKEKKLTPFIDESKCKNTPKFTACKMVSNQKYLIQSKPIVKLHSSPESDSGDEKFDREYEELLTFETIEDERREQRLLKALSDIAAKAKQKIQSITESNSSNVNIPTKHLDDSTSKCSYIKTYKESVKQLDDIADDKSEKSSNHYNDGDDDYDHNNADDDQDKDDADNYDDDDDDYDDYSPKSKFSPKRSRKDDENSKKSVRSRSPSIPRRRGSPSFLDRRRITSARKKPIPYQRATSSKSEDDDWSSS